MPWQLPAVHHLRREAAGEGRAAAALLIGVPWVSGQAAPHTEPPRPWSWQYDCCWGGRCPASPSCCVHVALWGARPPHRPGCGHLQVGRVVTGLRSRAQQGGFETLCASESPSFTSGNFRAGHSGSDRAAASQGCCVLIPMHGLGGEDMGALVPCFLPALCPPRRAVLGVAHSTHF